MIPPHWNDVAKVRGFPTMRALLITRYVLQGRPTGWLCKYLVTSRWTIADMLHAEGITPHGHRMTALSHGDRQYWQAQLRNEYPPGEDTYAES